MARVFPDGDYESWTQCRTLLAHAKIVLRSINDTDDEDRLNAATLWFKCGWFLALRGAYKEAEAMNQRALEARENVLGLEHPDTLGSVNNLGSVLSSQGGHEEAEAMHRQVLETREKALGREHPYTLGGVDNLGNVLSRQGKYEEAKVMYRRALEARVKVLGHEHPDTLANVIQLALVLFGQEN